MALLDDNLTLSLRFGTDLDLDEMVYWPKIGK